MPDPVNKPDSGTGEAPETSATPGTSPAGDTGGSSGASEDGRSLKQLRGELLRKHNELAAQVTQLTEGITKLTQHLGAQGERASNAPAQAPNPYSVPMGGGRSYGAPNPLAQYRDEELRAALASGTLNQYQVDSVREELKVRDEGRRFDQRFDERLRKQQFDDQKRQNQEDAKRAFPALRDPNSEFSQRVAAELKSRREQHGENPRDEFDAANYVSRTMNVEVSRVFRPGYIAPGTSGDDDRGGAVPEEDYGISKEEAEELARKFAYALPSDTGPDGKVKRRQFDLNEILKSSREYGEARTQMMGKGRKVRGKSRNG